MKKFLLTLACVLFAWTAGAQFYSDYAWMTIPDHDDWLYKTVENASVEVIFVKYGIPRDGVLSYEISDDMQPADFTAFWNKAVAEAEKFPLTVTREAVSERNTMREDCFLVKVMVNETQGLYGYLYVPKAPSRTPARW